MSEIWGKKTRKSGKYSNCLKSEMFKCHTDIINYLFTSLT